jgi:hypothetical protein
VEITVTLAGRFTENKNELLALTMLLVELLDGTWLAA